MVFDGFGPLVERCDGFDGSSWSNYHHLGGRTHGGGRHVVLARVDYIVSVSIQHLFAEPLTS